MIRTLTATLAALVATAAPAPAFAADDPAPRITVSGTGSVRTPPTRAIVGYSIRGEGATSDAAVSALVVKRRAIDDGVGTLRVAAEVSASRISIVEVRSPECRQGYNSPQLSTGPCAVLGYTADMEITVRTDAVKQIGTMVGLLGRLGATNPRLDNFELADPRAAQTAAIAAALADARAKARSVADGAGVKIGRLLFASNTGGGYQQESDIIVSASRVSAPPAPPRVSQAIAVDLSPQPITTRAQVTVAYEIVR